MIIFVSTAIRASIFCSVFASNFDHHLKLYHIVAGYFSLFLLQISLINSFASHLIVISFLSNFATDLNNLSLYGNFLSLTNRASVSGSHNTACTFTRLTRSMHLHHSHAHLLVYFLPSTIPQIKQILFKTANKRVFYLSKERETKIRMRYSPSRRNLHMPHISL